MDVSETAQAATFEQVYRAHSGPVYRFVLYMTRDSALAEDLTAETFLRVWSSAVPFQMETVRGWLIAIARNLIFERTRRARHVAEVQLTADAPENLRFDQQLDARSELAFVLAELQKMSEEDRTALLLRVEGELPFKDIAHILGTNEPAARVRVFRARAALAKATKERYGNQARSLR